MKGAGRRPLQGKRQALKGLGAAMRFNRDTHGEVRPVNGRPGIVAYRGDEPVAVIAITVVDGLITAIDTVVNPEKLTRVPRP